MDKTSLIAIRNYTPDDQNFILATWLRGLRYGNEWFEAIDGDAYYAAYPKVIQSIIVKGASIKVACLKEDPTVILGYSVSSGPIIHWVHVKKAWRGIGLAKALTPENFTTVTHLTKPAKSILRSRPSVKFNPFL